MVKFLCEEGRFWKGWVPNPLTTKGWSAAFVAAFKGHAAAIRTLAEAGLDLAKRATGDFPGFTPLDIALHRGNVDAAKALAALGAPSPAAFE